MIGWFSAAVIGVRCFGGCSFGGPLSHSSLVVVFLDGGHPCFRDLYCTIPVDVVRVKSFVSRLFDPACVPCSSKNT